MSPFPELRASKLSSSKFESFRSSSGKIVSDIVRSKLGPMRETSVYRSAGYLKVEIVHNFF